MELNGWPSRRCCAATALTRAAPAPSAHIRPHHDGQNVTPADYRACQCGYTGFCTGPDGSEGPDLPMSGCRKSA